MKIFKTMGKGLLGILGLVVVLYLAGLAWNWRDQPPSAASLHLRGLLENRPPVADEENAFVYFLGFAAPVGEDPQALGARRSAWIAAVNLSLRLTEPDPLTQRLDFEEGSSQAVRKVQKACGDEAGVPCQQIFTAARSEPRTQLEQLQLARYRTLLQRKTWRERIPLDLRVSLDPYKDVLAAQRLLFVSLGAEERASPEDVSAWMRADFAFWREVQQSADFLITKMIALAALRQHFKFGNLLLREQGSGMDDLLADWATPFTKSELSMRQTMAGELLYAESVARQSMESSEYLEQAITEDPISPLAARITHKLLIPYYQPQDQSNYFAARHLESAQAFEVPLDQYLAVAARREAVDQPPSSWRVYNLVGHFLREFSSSFDSYAIRVASIEGQRRAALLTAQLRQRRVPVEQLPEQLGRAELRNPFDNSAFTWNAELQAVEYTAPEAEGNRSHNAYLY